MKDAERHNLGINRVKLPATHAPKSLCLVPQQESDQRSHFDKTLRWDSSHLSSIERNKVSAEVAAAAAKILTQISSNKWYRE